MQISNARNTLEAFLTKLNIEVRRIEVVAGDPHPILSVSTPDSALLIGPGGEHLRALNYLIKKIIEHKYPQRDDEPGFLVDVNGYYRKHLAALKQQAGILAERARAYKAEVAMPPLSSYERMIVHAVYADDSDIYTESVGIGKDRHIVFKYREANGVRETSDRELFSESSSTTP